MSRRSPHNIGKHAAISSHAPLLFLSAKPLSEARARGQLNNYLVSLNRAALKHLAGHLLGKLGYQDVQVLTQKKNAGGDILASTHGGFTRRQAEGVG